MSDGGAARSGPRHLVVVPHTHWDREWYLTHEQFRHRLVRLVDHLLGLLDADPGWRHFMLDGQTIVADDYLAVRPEARERLAKWIEAGRLLVGPWTVLPDEWLVSGEALVRNLRRGLARGDALGGAMRLGYVPDQFGHVGQLPQIFAGFGFDAAALWRGVGDDVSRTLFDWEAPDGTRLLTVYLKHGYGNAAHLPATAEGLAARLDREGRRLADDSPVPTLLLMAGTDHQEPLATLPALLAAAAADGVTAEVGTLPGFVARARAELAPGTRLEVHRGELRSGLRAPLLPGCASTRMPQKRADFENDRLLVRWLEPLAAWWGSLGGAADPAALDFAWSVALENHPHDSICGCSVDAVHDQMDARFARVREWGEAELARVLRGLAAHVDWPATSSGTPDDARLPVFAAWSPTAAGRGPAAVDLDLDGDEVTPLHVRGADGAPRPSHVEVLSPRRTLLDLPLPPRATRTLLGQLGPDFLGFWQRGVEWGEEGSGAERRFVCRVRVGVAPGDPARIEAERRACLEACARTACEAGRFELVRGPRVRAHWVDDWPGHGLRCYRLATGRGPRGRGLRGERRADGGVAIANGRLRLEAGPDGRVTLERTAGPDAGLRVEDALRLVSEADRGDEYNFDPLPGARDASGAATGAAERVERPERVRVSLLRRGTASLGLRVRARYRVPASLAPDRAHRSARRVALPVELRLWLHADVDRVDVEVELENRARDHRLRLLARAPFAAEGFEVESAFEVAGRPIAPDPEAAGAFQAERPVGAGPQRTFATLRAGARALTVANRGLAEADAVLEPDGSTSLAVTLLRAVGWLSRDDLWLRPMHAGPPFETPGAQVPGAHRAELSLRWHGAGDPARAVEAHRFAYPPIAIQGEAGREPGGGARLQDGARLVETDDPTLVVSAIEPRQDGAAILRLYDVSGVARRASLRWCGGGSGRLEPVTLDERPDPRVRLEPDPDDPRRVRVDLRPWQIVTLRAR